jgi:hypothetical protein
MRQPRTHWSGWSRPARGPIILLAVLCVVAAAGIHAIVQGPAPTAPLAAQPMLLEPRAEHTATLLPDGRILVIGGVGSLRARPDRYLASAELVDPETGISSPAGSMAEPRDGHTATLLPDGRVLVVGGGVQTAEIWDSETLSFSAAGDLPFAVYGHTATLLPDGRVLVAGGEIAALSNAVLEDAQIWDPASGAFSTDGSLRRERWDHTATLLPDGRVLIVGGGTALAANELRDPASGMFERAPRLAAGRYGHTATLLPDDSVLVVGGTSAMYAPNSISEWLERSVELRDPDTGRFRRAGRLAQGRGGHTATLLPDGHVVVLGGSGRDGLLSSTEIREPGSGRFVTGPALAQARSHHSATLLPDGRLVVLGGIGREAGRRAVLDTGEIWALSGTSPIQARPSLLPSPPPAPSEAG